MSLTGTDSPARFHHCWQSHLETWSSQFTWCWTLIWSSPSAALLNEEFFTDVSFWSWHWLSIPYYRVSQLWILKEIRRTYRAVWRKSPPKMHFFSKCHVGSIFIVACIPSMRPYISGSESKDFVISYIRRHDWRVSTELRNRLPPRWMVRLSRTISRYLANVCIVKA